jgi:2-desacetyl-2-hydroxyethyl bacteriochlorophyllide A dehydrogenase
MVKAAQALVYASPGAARIEDVDLAEAGHDTVTVRALYSAISRGTERLVFEGRVPEAEWGRMRAPFQIGDFPFPVRYGYAAVGRVEEGPDDLVGRDVFALHPHQTAFRLPANAVVPVPDGVPAKRAVLAANMETALNAIWDAKLCPGCRCLVVGAGLLGWLVTALLSLRADISVDITDISPESGMPADELHVRFMSPEAVQPGAYDVVFHTSASAAGLQTAIDALAFEGRVIELSWYGDRPVEVSLGGNFHASRLSIISSQVGHVATPRRAALDYRGRLEKALAALKAPALDTLITEDVKFSALPDELPRLLAPQAPGIATRIVYD